NSSTIGYKEVATAFQSFVASSSNTGSQGGGVLARPIYENGLQGGLTSVANQTAIAVNGQGFLAVQQPFFQASGPSFNNVPISYPRAADFQFNANGYLVNSQGQYLLGVPNQGGTFNISANQVTQVQKNANNVTTPGTATANVNYNINFPANAITTTN